MGCPDVHVFFLVLRFTNKDEQVGMFDMADVKPISVYSSCYFLLQFFVHDISWLRDVQTPSSGFATKGRAAVLTRTLPGDVQYRQQEVTTVVAAAASERETLPCL